MMKKILAVKKEAPLESVNIKVHFSKELWLDVSKAGKLAEMLKPYYVQEPNLVLLPLLKIGQTIDIPVLHNLRFLDEQGLNWLELGKDFIIFNSKKYSFWTDYLEIILNSIIIFKEITGISEILDIHMTYIDTFRFPKEDFKLNDYFSLSIKIPEDWKIKPHDFFIGIVPYEDKNRKIILRLKGTTDKDDLLYRLETVSIGTDLKIPIEKEKLSNYLSETHDIIEHYFIEYLTEEFLSKLGIIIQ